MDKAAVRTRQITKKLSKVQELPSDGATPTISLTGGLDTGEEADDPALFENEA
jgi:hypothetical protein